MNTEKSSVVDSPIINESVSAVSTIPVNAVKRRRISVSTVKSEIVKKSRLSSRSTSTGAAVALRFENGNSVGGGGRDIVTSPSKSLAKSLPSSLLKIRETSEKAFTKTIASIHEGSVTISSLGQVSTTSTSSSRKGSSVTLGVTSSSSSRNAARSSASSYGSSSLSITRVLCASNEMQWSAVNITSSGTSPSPRWGHAQTLLKPDGGEMLINGGESIDGDALADTYILSVPSSTSTSKIATWSKEPFSPDAPRRKWHSLVHWHAADRGWILALGQLGESQQELQQTDILSSVGASGAVGADSAAVIGQPEYENPCTVDDLSTFDPSCSLWFAPAVTGRVPVNRHGHSMTLVPSARMPQASALQRGSESVVVVFGGVRSIMNTKKGTRRMQYLNDLYAWPVSSHKWHHIATTEGRAPKARSFHSAAAVGSKLIIFGGTDGEESFDDVSYLACEPTVSAPDTWTWHQPLISGKGPCPRSAASATVIGDRFVLFIGGHDTTEEITQRPISSEVRSDQQEPLNLYYDPETGLSSQLASLIVKELLACDQSRKSGAPFADAWLLDTHAWEWIRLAAPSHISSLGSADQFSVDKFCGRAGHSAALIRDARALVYKSTPTTVTTSSDSLLSAVVVFGGKTESGVTSDVSVLTLPQSLMEAAILCKEDNKEEEEVNNKNYVDVKAEEFVEEEEEEEEEGDALTNLGLTSTSTEAGASVRVFAEEKPVEDDGWGQVE